MALIANPADGTYGTQPYDPYGAKRAGTGLNGDPLHGFQSDLTDPDTGLVDMGARLYDPTLGRFTSRDPVFGDLGTPPSLNGYAYAHLNPVTLMDPDGYCPRDPDNQEGCGYTKTSNPSKKDRYDDTFGEDPYGYISASVRPASQPEPVFMLGADLVAFVNKLIAANRSDADEFLESYQWLLTSYQAILDAQGGARRAASQLARMLRTSSDPDARSAAARLLPALGRMTKFVESTGYKVAGGSAVVSAAAFEGARLRAEGASTGEAVTRAAL